MTHLVFFCGHAGTGKTTLAKKLIGPLMQASSSPFCLLDKDTLFGGYSAAAMSMLTGDPNDRDSPLFLQHLRDPEYRGLLDTARDNLEIGVSALVVGPLSREVRERRLFDRAWLGIDADVTLRWCGSPHRKRLPISVSSSAAIRTMPTNSRIGTNIGSAASCRAARFATTC